MSIVKARWTTTFLSIASLNPWLRGIRIMLFTNSSFKDSDQPHFINVVLSSLDLAQTSNVSEQYISPAIDFVRWHLCLEFAELTGVPCWTSDTGADTILTDNPIIPVSVLYSLLGFNANVKLTDLIVIIFLITDRMFAVKKKQKGYFFHY